MRKLSILVVLILLFSLKSYSQEKFTASLGMGLPELVNAGIQYQLSQVKFGVGIGTAFAGFYSLSGDVYYHFKSQAGLNQLSPWYLRANISYWPFGKILFFDLGEALWAGFRAGREINLSDTIGLRIDAGITPFTFLSGTKVPFSFLPGFSAGIFFRL